MTDTQASPAPKAKLQWLLSPWTVLTCLAAGVALGISLPQTATRLAPIGDLYLRLLQMCVLPIMVTAIISSVTRLLASKMSGRVLLRIILVFCAGLVLASFIGVAAGVLGQPGADLDQEAKEVMGQLITSHTEGGLMSGPDMELYLDQDNSAAPSDSAGFLKEIIPENIFDSLQQGHTLQILFFSLVLGVALGFVSEHLRDRLLSDIEAVFQAFITIIGWLMYLLPLGLLFLVASQIAEIGLEVMGAMTKYILWAYIGCFLLVLINSLVISLSTKTGLIQTFQLLRQPLLISFFTRNGFAAMPSAIESMHENFRIDKNTTNFVIPLGITLCRFGTVMAFSLSVVFMAQLFGVQLDLWTILFIAFASVLAAIASAGAPGVVALTMISIVLEPLGLPLEVALVLLLAVDPITDPPLTLINVQTNCAACSLIQNS
ncbi:MAG: cation:dicarboxylase symporter family transporter [Desulfohalobiaceae bacterium]